MEQQNEMHYSEFLEGNKHNFRKKFLKSLMKCMIIISKVGQYFLVNYFSTFMQLRLCICLVWTVWVHLEWHTTPFYMQISGSQIYLDIHIQGKRLAIFLFIWWIKICIIEAYLLKYYFESQLIYKWRSYR